MRDDVPTIDSGSSANVAPGRSADEVTALMIAWAPAEPRRVGEVALFEAEGASLILGRGGPEGGARVAFQQQRPSLLERRPPLASPGISRDQLRIRLDAGRLHVEQLGRCALVVKGERVERAIVAPGDTLLLKGQILLLCTRRGSRRRCRARPARRTAARPRSTRCGAAGACAVAACRAAGSGP